MTKKPLNILIVGPSWVGDMVMSQTLYKVIKQRSPSCQIDVIAPVWSERILSRMPEIRDIIPLDIGHGELAITKRYHIAKSLRAKHYDQAIILPNSFKSALISWLAKIPLRTGWRGEMRYGVLNDIRILDKTKYPQMIQRFAALGLPKNEAIPSDLPWPKLEVNEQTRSQVLSHYKLSTSKPILALCPGAAFGPAKRWPAEYYAAVATHQIKHGWQVWLFGGKGDTPTTNEIQRYTNNACVDLTSTSLPEAIDLLSLSNSVITNDSGLMHIAAALDRPLVAVYGSSSPTYTPPLSKQAKIVTLNLDCSPCFKRDCPLGHTHCLKQLTPEHVITALE